MNSVLRVPESESLSVVGGDIEVSGNATLTIRGIPTLSAPSGQVHLVSVASAGEVAISHAEAETGLNVETFEQLGNLTLSPSSLIDVSSGAGNPAIIQMAISRNREFLRTPIDVGKTSAQWRLDQAAQPLRRSKDEPRVRGLVAASLCPEG